jgi:hypothetical protein
MDREWRNSSHGMCLEVRENQAQNSLRPVHAMKYYVYLHSLKGRIVKVVLPTLKTHSLQDSKVTVCP